MLAKLDKLYRKYLMPVKYYADDTFLVSYPKSGNTWVRFMLANVMTNGEAEINFHTAVDHIPDIDVHKKIANHIQPPRILKSHQPYNSKFSNVVYIIRDPRDVYVSYYFYLQKKLKGDLKNINHFIKNIDTYGISWRDHVNSWMDKLDATDLIIRYEDLIHEPYENLKKMADFCHLNYDEELLRLSVERSSFDSMSKIEDSKGRPFTSKEDEKKASKFVRAGKIGDWKNHLDKDTQQYLENKCKVLMNKFGYL
ncbi:MAG: sulfotransferase domain-containing protein [Bacteroidetes bacterium]|nr:sulfotransferase domain-containing protein [Bacteroidota bacterium]